MRDYGCFTTVLIEAGGVRGWNAHCARLRRDSEAMFDRAVAADDVVEAVRASLPEDGAAELLRIAVTARDHSLARPGGVDLEVAVQARRAHRDHRPLRLGTIEHRRALPRIKNLGTAPDLLMRRAAQLEGHDDALFHADGLVTEGPTWSLIVEIGDQVVAPVGGLRSVTVDLLSQRRPIDARPLLVSELVEVTAAVAVNAGWGVRGVDSIDGRRLSAGLANRLGGAYADVPFEAV